MSSIKEESISKGESNIKKETNSTGCENPIKYDSKNSNEDKDVDNESTENKKNIGKGGEDSSKKKKKRKCNKF